MYLNISTTGQLGSLRGVTYILKISTLCLGWHQLRTDDFVFKFLIQRSDLELTVQWGEQMEYKPLKYLKYVRGQKSFSLYKHFETENTDL